MAFRDIISICVIVGEIQVSITVDGEDQTFAFDKGTAGAVLTVAHTAGGSIIEADLCRTAAGVLDGTSGFKYLVVIRIRQGMVVPPEENDRLAGAGGFIQSVDHLNGISGIPVPGAFETM